MKKEQQLQDNESLLDQVREMAAAGKVIVEQTAADLQRPRPDDSTPFDSNRPLVTPALLGHMLDAAPVIAVQLTKGQHDPVIVHATQRIEQIFGYGPDELAGVPLSTLIPENVRPAHESYMKKFINEPVNRQLGELADVPCPQGRRKDGTVFYLEIMLTVCVVSTNRFGVATIMPQVRPAHELARV